jgi:hypothetical protein
MEWIKTTEKLPDRQPGTKYSQVPCLVYRDRQIEILVFNHEHMVWDTADMDDFECNIYEVSYWMPLPEPPNMGNPA